MGQPVYWHTKYNFRVQMDGSTYAYFTTCGPIAPEIGVIEHFEGGQRHPHKLPGLEKWPDVELTRGASENADLWNAFLDTYSAANAVGRDAPALHRTIEIEHLNAQREVALRWILHNAWLSKYSSGDSDQKAEEVRIESATITFEWADRQLA